LSSHLLDEISCHLEVKAVSKFVRRLNALSEINIKRIFESDRCPKHLRSKKIHGLPEIVLSRRIETL
jgi:hypothetical protein